jgi:very-short-patch-repair endonuclease
MSTLSTLLDAPEHLMAAHDRLRGSGFPIVSLVNAHSSLEARTWIGRWARARGRVIAVAPDGTKEAAIAAYRARMPRGELIPPHQLSGAPTQPVLLIPGEFRESLPLAVGLVAQHPHLPVAVVCGIADMVKCLLDTITPQGLVGAALQGLVPVANEERQVLDRIAAVRQVIPFLRGACEGLLYYMLEARQETRGSFAANARLQSTIGNREHEVDLACVQRRLVIEIDGPEHDQQTRKAMDIRKQRDLEAQGFQVRRFSNYDVIENPVGVWRVIADDLKARRAIEERST